MARTSLDLIDAMRDIAEEVRPVTGRGIGYKRFTRRLITSMSTNNMQKVYRLLRVAREQGSRAFSVPSQNSH
ncbi:putative lactoylglutathione lyase [Bradyrhizobium japonicum]